MRRALILAVPLLMLGACDRPDVASDTAPGAIPHDNARNGFSHRQQGIERIHGAVVARIEPGAPAHTAGIREGDVILGIDDVPVRSVSDLQVQLAQIDPGSSAEIHVLRNGRTTEMTVALGILSTAQR